MVKTNEKNKLSMDGTTAGKNAEKPRQADQSETSERHQRERGILRARVMDGGDLHKPEKL